MRVAILATEATISADSAATPELTANVFGVRIVAGHIAVFFTASEWRDLLTQQGRRERDLA